MARLKLQKIYICVFLLTSIHAFSQSSLFVRNISQQDRLVYVDSNGYYFNGSHRFYKTDTLGTPLWAKYISAPYNEILHLSNGDFLLSFEIAGNAGFRMERIDSQGTIIWQKEYLSLLSNPYSDCSVIEDDQSNLFVARIANDSVLEVLKVDSSGNLLFSKKISNSVSYISFLYNVSLLSRSNGNIVIFYHAYHFGGNSLTNIIEMDNNLNSVSNQTCFFDLDVSSAIEKNNSIFLTGSLVVTTSGGLLKLFMQLDSSLNFVRAVCFTPPKTLLFSITEKNEFLITYNSSIMLLDSLFQTVWIKDIDQSHNLININYFYAFETPEKNIVCSFSEASNSSFFAKLDSLGNSACTFVNGLWPPVTYTIANSLIDSVLIDTTLYGAVNNTNYTSSGISIQSNVICTTSIEDESLIGNEISLYPNPFYKAIDLSIDETLLINSEKKQLFVYNAIGELVLSENDLNSKMKIEMNDAKSGIYFVRIVIGEQQLVRKIIKE